jgi:hypothetical protein
MTKGVIRDGNTDFLLKHGAHIVWPDDSGQGPCNFCKKNSWNDNDGPTDECIECEMHAFRCGPYRGFEPND